MSSWVLTFHIYRDPFLLRNFPRDQAGKHFNRAGFEMFTELVTPFAEN
jgi:hypothetical protein